MHGTHSGLGWLGPPTATLSRLQSGALSSQIHKIYYTLLQPTLGARGRSRCNICEQVLDDMKLFMTLHI
jgi:hypothetical protein